MNRAALADQIRRIRDAENRPPTENAVLALAALTPDQIAQALARFNTIHNDSPTTPQLTAQAKKDAA